MTGLLLVAIAIAFYFIIRVATSKNNKIETQEFDTKAKKDKSEEIQKAVEILAVKHTVDEIVKQAQDKEPVFLWFDINHLTENDLICIAEKLNKTQLRRWYKYFHDIE